jgi:AraC-like DNA-binding protein
MTVADLAQRSGMSVSSFHTHFKSITSMSPLQYQKMVRLQQARTLLKSRIRDVSSAAYEVGYTSTSQFSREYSRAFGVAPSRDIL